MEWSSTEQAITHVALTKNPRGLRNFAPLSLVVCTASEVGTTPRLCLPCPAQVWLPADCCTGVKHVGFCVQSAAKPQLLHWLPAHLQSSPPANLLLSCVPHSIQVHLPACMAAHHQALACWPRLSPHAPSARTFTGHPTCTPALIQGPRQRRNACTWGGSPPPEPVSTSTHLCHPLPADPPSPTQATHRPGNTHALFQSYSAPHGPALHDLPLPAAASKGCHTQAASSFPNP